MTTIQKILLQNQYSVKETSNKIEIEYHGGPNKKLNFYQNLGSLLCLFGLLFIATISILAGIIVLSAGIPMILQAKRIKSELHSFPVILLEIKKDIVLLQGEMPDKSIPTAAINKISYSFKYSDNLSTAEIKVNTSNEDFSILRLINDDRRKLDHDAEDIVQYLSTWINIE